jgi:polyisoprenoid-binding protein YceI
MRSLPPRLGNSLVQNPLVLAAFSILTIHGLAQASTLNLKAETPAPQVEFQAVGRPSALKIRGRGDKLTASLSLEQSKLKGAVEFELGSLDTGMGLRDRHMKEKYLAIEEFPKSRFEVTTLELPATLTGTGDGEAELKVPGTLTLHGVTQPVEAQTKITKIGSQLSVSAQFAIKLPVYGIDIPKFAGITVAEDVTLKVDFALVQGN